jgi:hypothetical protein
MIFVVQSSQDRLDAIPVGEVMRVALNPLALAERPDIDGVKPEHSVPETSLP